MKKRLFSNIMIICIVIAFIFGILSIRTFVYPLKYKEQIIEFSNKNNLDPYLAFAIINTESKFNENATSNKQAKGLMQITEATAKEVNDVTQSTDEINDLTIYDINVNIEIGCNYLASLITRYNGNYYLAICAYNAGIGNVNKWLDQGLIPYDLDSTDIELPFNETTNYLKKVIKSYKAYKRVYPSLS